MKRYLGMIVLILALCLVGPAPPGWTAPGSGNGDTSMMGKPDRRDLGEKGRIVIESLDLNEADLADVVRLLARISGINIITGDLKGSITVYLENVTVQAALTAILSSQGYGYIFDGNIVRVVDARKLGEDRVETITETFLLNYLPADNVADSLRKVFSGNQAGSSASQIEANIEANAIIVVDIPRRVEDIRKLVEILDRRFEQVEIEGRFVEISYNQEQEWGVDWKYFQDPANTLDVNLSPSALNASDVAGQFKFAIINGRDNLTGFLQALETNNDIRILADPKILALENKEATIELTDEIPFVEANVSNGVVTESIQFQETGIRLIVTPQIAQEQEGTYVRMKLELEQRIAGPNVVLQNSTAFPIDSRRAMSELIVPDDSTVIIGGLRSNDLTYTYEKIPLVGNIPLLGKAFQHRVKRDDQKELLLFVTPRVIYDHPPLDCKEQQLHDKIDEVVDSLETQNEWRETVEAPYELLEKDVLYSGVENNPDIYSRILKEKKQLERVKPYKVSKPKGQRQFRIKNENGILKEEVIESDAPIEEDEGVIPPVTGEVRSFKAIEKAAKPGMGRPEEEMAPAEGQEPAFPMGAPMYLPPESPEGTGPAVIPEGSRSKEVPNRPGWLRRGARESSDAGNQEDSKPAQVGMAPPIENSPAMETYDLHEIPDEPPAPMALVDEIPFAPIEEELHKQSESTAAPASIQEAVAGEYGNEDPWHLGLKPRMLLEPLPLVSEGEISPSAQLLTQAENASPSKPGAPLITGAEIEPLGAVAPPEKRETVNTGFVPVVEITPAASMGSPEEPPNTGNPANRTAALAEAERLQIIASQAAGMKAKNDLVDKSKILAYNDSKLTPAPESASSPPQEQPSWWRKLTPKR